MPASYDMRNPQRRNQPNADEATTPWITRTQSQYGKPCEDEDKVSQGWDNDDHYTSDEGEDDDKR